MKVLVLEGGAHRGIYTAGVLDAFLENNITFDGVIGVSAGAIHGASFMSRQKGRSVNYTADYCSSKKYMGFSSLLRTGNYFNEQFCYYELPSKLYPFDHKSFAENPAKFYVVCTDLDSGQALYHYCPELTVGGLNMKYLQASASMPVVSKALKLEGHSYVDGGIADSVPEKAFRNLGYTRNVVVLTQEEKSKGSEFNAFVPMAKFFYPRHKEIIKALESQNERYYEELEYLYKEEKAGNILIVRPSVKPSAGVMERKPQNIRDTHNLGYNDALKMMDKIKDFLSL